LFDGKKGEPLLEDDFVIMEIKAPGQEPKWLRDILEKYGLVKQKFSKKGKFCLNPFAKSRANFICGYL
ncbi:MAG: VTC domain-containing protein, partial [Campylobacter sp.]